MSGEIDVRFTVNGTAVDVRAHPLARLLDVLRLSLKLTGTKEGCGEGECGACSVFVDGELVNSCLVPVCQVDGRTVETIEGVARRQELAPLTEAFVELGGAQCGICTPGMILAATALVRRGGATDDTTIRDALAGNLCRCTGYVKIVDAVARACERIRATGDGAPHGAAPRGGEGA
ncbi:MAG TPA: (2Fe-2S)-binding protein [Nannocystaceae bacterium]|nr:(2Fe-2S)-binding protein [Nannocystaceae bacterium]